MPVSNRIKAGLLIGGLLSIIFAFWLAETPTSWYASPFYWIGFVPSGIIGFFFIGQDYLFPVPGRTKKSKKIGYIPVGVAAIILAVSSKVYPDAIIVVFGIAMALYAGLGLRFGYLLVFRSRWSYCPKCEKPSWLLEVDGKWYCNKKGHLYQEGVAVETHKGTGPIKQILATSSHVVCPWSKTQYD